MDEVDSRIVNALSRNSRISFRKIAAETGLSADTVIRRFHRLKQENVFQTVITIDLSKFGYEATVFFAAKVTSQANIATIIENVAKIPDITAVGRAIGDYDLLLTACAKSIRHVSEIGERIAETQGIIKVSLDQIRLEPHGNFIFPPQNSNNLSE